MVADIVGGRFVQHVPVDVVVDLWKREMEHGERMILTVSFRVREYCDCDIFAPFPPGALDESVLDLPYGIRICIEEPHVLRVVRPVLVTQLRHSGLVSTERLPRESSHCVLYRSATHRLIGKGGKLLSIT